MIYIPKHITSHSPEESAEEHWKKKHREAEFYGMQEVEKKNLTQREDDKLKTAQKEMKKVILFKDKINVQKFAQAKENYRRRYGPKRLKEKLREYYGPLYDRDYFSKLYFKDTEKS